MKQLAILLGAFLMLVFPLISQAHGELGDGDEHHMGEMVSGMMGDDSDGQAEEKASEPCVIGSVIKCGDHGEGSSQTLDAVENDLLVGFNVYSVDQLDCDEIVDHDFEHVGEALMSYMHPDDEEHEQIDVMMGGEGSESLESMHVFMGKRYLGCTEGSYGPMMMNFDGSSDFGGGMMGMMAMPFQMMSGNFHPLNFTSMMGGGYFVYGLFQLVVWILAILGIAWIVQSLSSKNK